MIPEMSGANSAVLLPRVPATLGGYPSPRDAEPVSQSSPMFPGVGNYLCQLLARVVAQLKKINVRQNRKRLRVCETVALGDKRFVAVIQVDDQQFLLGGSASSVSLLAQLDKPTEFAQVLSARVAEANG